MSLLARLNKLETSAPAPDACRPCKEWHSAAVDAFLGALSDGEWHLLREDVYPRLQSLLTWQELTTRLLPWSVGAKWIEWRNGAVRATWIGQNLHWL